MLRATFHLRFVSQKGSVRCLGPLSGQDLLQLQFLKRVEKALTTLLLNSYIFTRLLWNNNLFYVYSVRSLFCVFCLPTNNYFNMLSFFTFIYFCMVIIFYEQNTPFFSKLKDTSFVDDGFYINPHKKLFFGGLAIIWFSWPIKVLCTNNNSQENKSGDLGK